MKNSKILSLTTLSTCLLLFISNSISAEQSLKAQDIEKLMPDYISQGTVEDKGKGVRITGQTASNQNISKYMRSLDTKVGHPSLISITRENNISVFILEIKEIK